MSTAAPDRRDRYGGPIVTPRTARLLLVLGALVTLSLIVWIGLRFADQPVTAKVTAYEHVAPDRIAVTFQVTKRPGAAASCAVQAMNKGAAQVGFVETEIPPSTQRQSSHRVEIATQGQAVSAEVLGCQETKETRTP